MTAYDDVVMADSPVLYYKLDEASGNFINYGSFGTSGDLNSFTGTITRQQAAIAPGLNQSVDIRGGTTARIGRSGSGYVPASGTGKPFTVEGWIQSDGTGNSNNGSNCFFGINNGTQQRAMLGLINPANPHIFTMNTAGGSSGNQFSAATGSIFTLNRPYYFCYQFYPSDVGVIYINARAYTLSTWASTQRYEATCNIWIGNSSDSFWGQLNGKYSNFAVYNKNLTRQDMERRMFAAAPANRIAYYGGLG